VRARPGAIAQVSRHRLVIRDADSLKTLHIFTCLDAINRVEWSPNSQLVLCAQYGRRTVQVWSVAQPEWTCRIDEGLAGLSYARWAPDGLHIVTCTDFSLRLTVWSLANKSVGYIRFPKSADKCSEFSDDGKLLAVVERRDYKDFVGIYSTATWEQIKHFQIESEDAAFIKWSPNGRYLAVADTPLEYRLLVYTPDGRRVMRYEAYENALGIKTLAWSPSSRYLAVGSYDEIARIVSTVTFRVTAELVHRSPLTARDVVVYSEKPLDPAADAGVAPVAESAGGDGDGTGIEDEAVGENATGAANVVAAPAENAHDAKERMFRRRLSEIQSRSSSSQSLARARRVPSVPTRYVIETVPYEFVQVRPEIDKPNPRLGVGLMAWSENEEFLCTRNDNFPCSIFLWETRRLSLFSVMNHMQAVVSAKWAPKSSTLIVCTEAEKVLLFAPDGVSVVPVPAPEFVVRAAQWHPGNKSVALMDRERFCCMFIKQDGV
jgi:WD40 repeat protein